MKISQVGAQLYTLRNHLKTPEDIAKTLKRVREIGFEVVQVSALGPIEESELVKILDGEGLKCVSTHESGDKIINEPMAIVERLDKLGTDTTAYPYPAGVDFSTLDGIKDIAKKLNNAGRVLKENGKTLLYHNHQIEFIKVAGKPALEWIYDLTDPDCLGAELDTYWVAVGGQDPAKWARRMKGRTPQIHLKDYMVTPEREVMFTEIGNGNLDFPEIIEAAEAGGCEWFLIEQDRCPGDEFESLKKSFDYCKEHLCT